ncbi:MAG TPA: ComEC/Rec2 family competence protein [Aquifex aeolicus]|nr:ComEC/Rec2 family competence protein [Aquifex aeolicus]
MPRNEFIHLVVFLVVCAVAWWRSGLESFVEDGVYVRAVVEGDVLRESGYIQARVRIEESEIEEIEGRSALLRVYGYAPVHVGGVSLFGRVSASGRGVFISANAEDVEVFRPKRGLREILMDRYVRLSFDKDATGLGLSFLFGQPRELLPSDLQKDFLRTGLVHLLVISGLHVGSIALILMKMLPRPWGLKLSLVGVLLYTAFVVPANPPVLRATIMFVFLILSALAFRQPNTLAILLFSGSIILLLYPHYLFSYSFWLSFIATAYILTALRDMEISKLWKSLTVSLAAFTGTASLVSTFSFVSPISVILTPLLAPLALAYSFLGVLSLMTFMSFPPLIDLFNLTGKLFAGSVSALSHASLQVYPSLTFPEAVIMTIAGIVSLYALKGISKLVPLLSLNGYLFLRANM